jgi:hypothetical protein
MGGPAPPSRRLVGSQDHTVSSSISAETEGREIEDREIETEDRETGSTETEDRETDGTDIQRKN